VEVHYKNRVSFPLTLKAYIIGQQEKDTIPEWVPADFLDPDVPQVGKSTCMSNLFTANA
jgi:hypothetical protein